jgi:hypothetical protein
MMRCVKKLGRAVRMESDVKRRPPAFAEKSAKETYSITLSARSRIDSGTLMPSAFAAFMFIANSNVVGCSMGRSAGFAPLRILST